MHVLEAFNHFTTYKMANDLKSAKVKRKDNSKKLTKVLSTKVSKEDYKAFRVLTDIVYQYRGIKEDSPSEMLRFFITLAVGELRNHPGFSLL
jgi:hypothetical protein